MAKRILYRIDQRSFEPGDDMPAPGDHIEDLPEKQQFAERILRREAGEHRAGLRAGLIFTFDSLDWTKRYYMGKAGRVVYELEVDEADIVHSADMMLFNDIADHGKDDEKAKQLAGQYWAGDKRDGKRVEHICMAARVAKVLCTPDQKGALKDELYPGTKPDFGDQAFYENMAKQFKD